MRALGDPVRLEIVRLLADGKLRSTGQVAEHVGLPSSTCSYHLKQLLAAGVNECRAEGAACRAFSGQPLPTWTPPRTRGVSARRG
ncbi:ArsR/SmtB family transcription factor [Microtetraspora fusca]|uniref:ArsR/SmtB family transcription factor n=2 Tax=Microtetraspora fusca TaxID=1997 RepID=A0ABW6VBD6_MICFU